VTPLTYTIDVEKHRDDDRQGILIEDVALPSYMSGVTVTVTASDAG